MNTMHFRYAVEIEKTHSITQAAENLYMAQPNLSKAIKELENTLGITIFRRTSKGVIPTDQGLKFLEYAKKILIQLDNMEAIHSPNKPKDRAFRISVPRTGYLASAFSDYAASLDSTHDYEVYYYETSSMKTIENVRDRGFDFGIIRYNKEHEKYFYDYLEEKNLSSDLLWGYKVVAVMPNDHPAANIENLTYNDMAKNYIEIFQDDASIPYVSGTMDKLMSTNRPTNIPMRRVSMCDRGSMLTFLSTNKEAFFLDSPIPEIMCNRLNLIQRKCDFKDNSFRDVLIYSSGHKFSDTELKLLNRFYETRNIAGFADIK